MTENDLVEKLAIKICDISNGNEWDATLVEEHKERHREVVREEILPLIRSYANALVAAAVEACAKRAESKVKSIEYDEAFDTDEAAWLVAQAVRNVTPEFAAKELERIKNEARFEEAKWWRFYTEGNDEPYWCAERIAELEAAKEK